MLFRSWMGWLAPMRVERAVIDKLHRDVARIVQLADVKQRFQIDAAEPVGSSPAQFAAHMRSELERWSKVVAQAGIRTD